MLELFVKPSSGGFLFEFTETSNETIADGLNSDCIGHYEGSFGEWDGNWGVARV